VELGLGSAARGREQVGDVDAVTGGADEDAAQMVVPALPALARGVDGWVKCGGHDVLLRLVPVSSALHI
jgi:hypothetical protein